ncbi:MAG TPA: hypothetical protein VGM13_00885 [Thermoanaerobaculia bacterium]
MTSAAARAWLEALGLEPRLPDTRFLEDLFHVFQRRVACETLTRPAGEAAAFDAEAFAAEWTEEERGLTGEERAKAFAWLAGEVGFDVTPEESLCSRPWAGAERDEAPRGNGPAGFSLKVNGPEAHRAVIARVEGRRFLADAGFPMPVLLPLQLPSKEIPSSFGTLSVASVVVGGGFRVSCDARGEVAELLRLGTRAEARAGGARAPAAPFALRVLDDRVLHWEDGVMTILDAWSVLRYPLAAAERAAFESLFALNLEGVELPAGPAAALEPALTVFHAVPLPPEDVRRGLARAARPASDLVAPPEAFIEAVPGGSRVARSARFLAPVPAAGPGESVRKTLVFHLAMDLLGLGA